MTTPPTMRRSFIATIRTLKTTSRVSATSVTDRLFVHSCQCSPTTSSTLTRSSSMITLHSPVRNPIAMTSITTRRHYSSPVLDLTEFTPDRIRNFSIIAHIDHGKSTLADRLLELTGTIHRDADKPRVLDKLKVEKERGITVKAQSASMFYTHTDGKEYLLNLVDTPGHVDFSYEVSRSLAACQGTILLVDAAQGIQAQTVANFFLAFGENLSIIPILNKIDLPGAEPDKVARQIETAFEIPAADVLQISAKTGINVDAILPSVIDKVPPPIGDPKGHFKALLFDSWYDQYVGVVCLIAVHDGKISKGDRIISYHTKQSYEIIELGLMHPEQTPAKSLHAGQVGYIHLGMKTTRDAHIGDTFYAPNSPVEITPLPGFKPAKSVVFAGLYPLDASEYNRLQDALDRLTLNDASVTVSRETSHALGQGFRLGFLGTLHMDVFSQRLEEEHDATVINTAPTVLYKVVYEGEMDERLVRNPAEFPEPDELGKVKAFYEPMVIGTLIFPQEYLGTMMDLCGTHRGEQLEYSFLDETRVLLKYKLPMAEILTDFYDQLKSRTQGYASFDYEEIGYEEADLVKVNLLLNTKPVDALATVVHRSQAERVAKEWVKRLKAVMDRQLVEIVIQAAVNGKVIARESMSALRKDVTAKLYGGDVTRKMKLLEKQKAGKRRMKSVAGGIQLPQEAFLTLIGGRNNTKKEEK
ncbi:Translation factor guf1 mitochondrial [Blyttiomyces sp. JEL0837]|nr:Translation factor guf1 mitochondrial [Blyttiomyces sp. JEL0837]